MANHLLQNPNDQSHHLIFDALTKEQAEHNAVLQLERVMRTARGQDGVWGSDIYHDMRVLPKQDIIS